jgi:transcriptional regulator with XRE-family HTH domain
MFCSPEGVLKMIGYTPAGMLIIKNAKMKNLALKDLAEKTSISYSHLINMLKGTRDITESTFKKICGVLKLSRDQKYELKEAVFISNQNISINTKNKREDVLRLIYWLVIKGKYLNAEQVSQCFEIVKGNNK